MLAILAQANLRRKRRIVATGHVSDYASLGRSFAIESALESSPVTVRRYWISEKYRSQLTENMHKPRLFPFIIVGVAGWLAAQPRPQPQQAPAKIDASSVWQIPPSFLNTAHAVCDASSHIADCIIDQMSKAGAPTAAVSFARKLYAQNHGDFGIMTGFQDEGPVAFAWITYPQRGNTNYGLLFVNGQPSIVNVENLRLLDRKTMVKSAQFRDLRNQFPQVDVWPGDRDGKTWPESQPGPSGGTQFVVAYPLINGCRACARAGLAIFAWNFDAKGKFLGTAFQGMTPAPLQ
jgi:hypothetical protein